MPGFIIFVHGVDTEPAEIPVYFVDSEILASRICEGMKENEFAMFAFRFEECTKSNCHKMPSWAVMIEDAQNGVYGSIISSIYYVAERMHSFMDDRRNRKKNGLADTQAGNGRSATKDDGAGGESAERLVTGPTKAKRSTVRGEGQAKVIAALTKHHKYGDGGCLNLDPIGNNELARLADVSDSTASLFFRRQFNGHTKYRAICSHSATLVAALKLLNQEFSPHCLFGAKPPDEDDREEE